MQKKILIVRFSSIGDIVLTTPVIRCIKQQLKAEVHFLTKQSFVPVLQANPYIDKLFSIEDKITEVLDNLKTENYDYIIDLHKNIRSRQVKQALKGKAYTLDKINWQKWVMVNFKMNLMPKVHIVDRYLDTVAGLGVQNDGQGLDYFIPAEDEIDMESVFRLNLQTEPLPYIAFVIGAAHGTKRMPIEKIIAISNTLRKPIILLGGRSERYDGERIQEKTINPHLINLCGKLNINQSASIVRQADKVLTNDTGLMHIAAALQKEIISVWGNTIPAFGMYPYYPKGMNKSTMIEVPDLKCRPCSKIGYQRCPEGHFRCMNDQRDAVIISSLRTVTVKD